MSSAPNMRYCSSWLLSDLHRTACEVKSSKQRDVVDETYLPIGHDCAIETIEHVINNLCSSSRVYS